jgi:hypothetical protein
MGGFDFGDRPSAALCHCQFELGAKNIKDSLDAGLSEGAEAPKVGPSDSNGTGAESQS